jgi:hypothetical protein
MTPASDPGASDSRREPPAGFEGPLAEYTALRQEMANRAQLQQVMLTTQLTITGAVFGFALSGPDRVALLLVLPVSGYLLCARYIAQAYAIARISRYLREHLHHRIPGGLGWDFWTLRQPRSYVRYGWLAPLMLSFPGAAAVAVLWVAVDAVRAGREVWERAGLLVLSGVGLAATVASAMLIQRVYSGGYRSGPLPPAPADPAP